MRRIIFIAIAWMVCVNAIAQENDLVNHNLGLSIEAGFSNLFLGESLSPAGEKTTPKIGGGGGLAAIYELQYKHLLFRTGFGVDYTLNSFDYRAPNMQVGIREYETTQYHYQFNRYTERTNYGVGYVPVMFGGLFHRMFFLVGAKVGVLPIGCTTRPSANVTIWGTDDDVIDPMHGLHTHEMQTADYTGDKTTPSFGQINAMLSAEIGINLDKRAWMSEKELRVIQKRERVAQRRKSYRKPLRDRTHYRLSFFADYGLTNMLNYQANPIGYREDGQIFPEGGLAAIPQVNTVVPYSTYGYHENKKAVLNNLLVGVKFAVLFELPHKHKDYKVSYPNITAIISSSETGKPIQGAMVSFADLQRPKSKPQQRTTNKIGMTSKGFKESDYAISVTRAGYLPSDTMRMHHGDEEDTIRIALALAPVVENAPAPVIEEPTVRSFILRNMHFATDKTKILPSSEQACTALYTLLLENPRLRIRIVGHTDDVATEEYNQKLSEGRARSVRNEMIKRGIDGRRIETEGRGELDPIVVNDSDEHRQMNRRVEVEIISGLDDDVRIEDLQLQH